MLTKLLKYEFKSTGRILLPLYCVLIIFTLINKVFFTIELGFGFKLISERIDNAITLTTMFIYLFIMVAIFIVTLIIIIQRYYKNLLGNEGYLMNTLPIANWKNILCKLIVAMSWSFISCIIACVSIFILAYFPGFISEFIRAFNYLWAELFYEIGSEFFLIIFEFLVLIILSIISSILLIYAAISIGHLSNKRKKLISFISFIVLHSISYFLYILIYQVFLHTMIIQSQINVNIYLVILIITLIINSLVYFFISNYCISKKLNLE